MTIKPSELAIKIYEYKELAEMDVRYKLKKVKGHYYG
jgi:hypothetical protein